MKRFWITFIGALVIGTIGWAEAIDLKTSGGTVVSPATGPGVDTCTGDGCRIGPAGISTDGGIHVTRASGAQGAYLFDDGASLGVYNFPAFSFRSFSANQIISGNNNSVGFKCGSAITCAVAVESYQIITPGDSTGTPGAATLNTGVGKSAIAIGASSVVITDSKVATTSFIFVTPIDVDATCRGFSATVAAGSFTVTCLAAATAATKFNWLVIQDG